jgi:hypothetical protein
MQPTVGKGLKRYPFVAWERLKPAIQWKQGQHVFTCGGTGTGKSTVAGEFLGRRSQVVVCVSKGMDPIFEGPYYNEYREMPIWRPGKHQRILLRPANQKTLRETRDHKRKVFADMLDNVLLVRGNWCVDIDETHYMSKTLGLRDEITDMLEQGRSAGISMWNNTQRPADIPLSIYVNSTHAFLFQAQEDYDLQRLANLGNKYTNAQEMRANLDALDSFETHELVYLDRTGVIPPVRTIVTKKGSKTSGAKKR